MHFPLERYGKYHGHVPIILGLPTLMDSGDILIDVFGVTNGIIKSQTRVPLRAFRFRRTHTGKRKRPKASNFDKYLTNAPILTDYLAIRRPRYIRLKNMPRSI